MTDRPPLWRSAPGSGELPGHCGNAPPKVALGYRQGLSPALPFHFDIAHGGRQQLFRVLNFWRPTYDH
jgi:hypothetical protein